MKPKVKTTPDLSITSPAHIEALRQGDEFLRSSWQRNVIEKYKNKSNEEIKADLQITAHPFAVLIENWLGDFNISTAIRNCNGFNCSKVFYIGNRRFDKRGSVGTINYTDVEWLSSFQDVEKLQDQYTLVGVDNVSGSIPMETYVYPQFPLLSFGEEGVGLTPSLQALCKDIIHISMHGSVRSFNCGTASGIACYDFVNKFKASKTF